MAEKLAQLSGTRLRAIRFSITTRENHRTYAGRCARGGAGRRSAKTSNGRSWRRRCVTVGRALDRPLERIQSDLRHLAPRLKAVAPAAISMSARSWINVRSRVRKALGLVRPMAPGRNTNQLTPAWEALWRPLASWRVKISTSRFVRWCSGAGTEPQDVSETSFREFRDHLDDALLKHPDATFAELVRGWRAAQATVEGWPTASITNADRRDHWTLP